MNTELERLRAENEQLKLHLEAVKTFFNHGVLFEQRNHLAPIIAYAQMLTEGDGNIFDGTHINPIESIERSARKIRILQKQTEDFIQAAVNQAFEASVFHVATLLDQIYSLPYCRLETFIDRNSATQERHLPDLGVNGELVSFDLCLERIAFEMNHIAENAPLELFLSAIREKCLIEISIPCPQDEDFAKGNSWAKRYLSGYVDPVSELIFGLYNGVIRIEKREHKIVSVLEFPLVEFEG